jgi:hypothetical protein
LRNLHMQVPHFRARSCNNQTLPKCAIIPIQICFQNISGIRAISKNQFRTLEQNIGILYFRIHPSAPGLPARPYVPPSARRRGVGERGRGARSLRGRGKVCVGGRGRRGMGSDGAWLAVGRWRRCLGSFNITREQLSVAP